MEKKSTLDRYFKGLDLKERMSVIETAKTLLELQKGNDILLTSASPLPQKEAGKEGIA
jgi:hypothetical protein